MSSWREDSERVTTGRAAVERRGDAVLEELARLGQARVEHHLPHVAVHVVHPGDARAGGPQRREERHAVPDLDQPVTRAVATEQLAHDRGREHHEPAVLAHDVVAVAVALVGVALGVGGAHRDLEARPRPTAPGSWRRGPRSRRPRCRRGRATPSRGCGAARPPRPARRCRRRSPWCPRSRAGPQLPGRLTGWSGPKASRGITGASRPVPFSPTAGAFSSWYSSSTFTSHTS